MTKFGGSLEHRQTNTRDVERYPHLGIRNTNKSIYDDATIG